ncbi:helix-turn-helix domain-containing protein [Enterococcus avium]|jgi:hypothetical protein|uniref:helix-turn-helix domain-containing protein n=1 Tax=Enterococcus avium TaxID=33945 RepID=UPI0020475A5D|nr:helix-turn-helix transcriptional regulator [Enterococcus avium]MDT2479091.1 helix-turn-helix transcriptional regulator [Enterococcus avium]DAL80027.1 MAG TPA: CI repressor [Caudoviricetes sp.]
MIQISLKAARVNSDLKQGDVVNILKESYGVDITRQRLAEYEKDATDVPISLAKQLSSIYGISEENIFFGDRSTLSYTIRMKNKSELIS